MGRKGGQTVRKQCAAFTLIELLIVVAIIAILAAIAVPNFLEAQVRSKVSRAHTDMRTLAIALEAYTQDWDRPPLDFTEWYYRYGVATWERHYCYRQLTTPIAYITSWLNDPFGRWPKGDERISSRAEMAYYAYVNFLPERAAGSPSAGTREAFARGYVWSLYSVGPMAMTVSPWIAEMLGRTAPLADSLGNIYDPTNGTVSKGQIYRTNKGILTGGELAR